MAITFNPYSKQTDEYVGLSTDTKPTDARNGSSFYEMDTKKMFLFDAEHGQWLEQFQFE